MDIQAEAHKLAATHKRIYGGGPSGVFSAPGRVNLIGEHTDYAGGFVMPAAIDFATVAAIGPRTDGIVSIYSSNFDETVEHSLDAIPAKGSGHWSAYPLGILQVLGERGIAVPAFSLSIYGDVPLGAGLSSSASIEIATMAALLAAAGTRTMIPGAIVIWFVRNHIAKGFALGRV